MEVHGLAVALDRLCDGKEREQVEVLVDAVGGDVGVDRAELTVRELGVAPVHDRLVRLTPGPEPHRPGPGEGPHRRVLGRGREDVGQLVTAGAHPLEPVVAVGSRSAMVEKSGGSIDRPACGGSRAG